MTLLPHKLDRLCAAYFSPEEQISIMENYEEYKTIIIAKSNTAAANKVKDECWQKTANPVNL